MSWFKRIGEIYSPQANGRVILLNGTSSSGKTSIAKELQNKLFNDRKQIFLTYALDDIALNHLPVEVISDAQNLIKATPRLVYTFHRVLREMAKAGNNVIADHVLQEEWWVNDFLECTRGLAVTSVAVKAPLEVLKQREQGRKNRTPGLPEYQYDKVHRILKYDVEIDTSQHDVQSCVQKILIKLDQ